uniref:Ig-like domain-containing protein n=1 Tax=Mastacembelus armatus TaxID=205130 RepID=A0A7N8XHG0_9TELE
RKCTFSFIPYVSHTSSVVVTSDRSQYFEYEQVSLSCQHFSSGDWTVWRYTDKGLELSQCGSGWGVQTSSSCNMKTVKLSSSGVYWCESNHRLSSVAINITVTDRPVILQSPVLPVTEGHDVTLHCKTKSPPSNLQAHFYKHDSLISSGPTGHMTIHGFSKADEGVYTCDVKGQGQSPPSWLLLRDDSDRASLTVSPDSSQHFEYEDLSLSCGANSSYHGWRVRRVPTSGGKISSCGEAWGTPTPFGCLIQTAKQPDSAVFWCESPTRQRSNSVNITVHGGAVILQSPVLPVMEGENITLICRTQTSSDLPADFYKHGSLIIDRPTGHVTILHVSKADEGVYRCNIRGHGESPPSWLFVRSEKMPVTMTTPRPPGEPGNGLDPDYDDVTTEHQF